MPFILIRRLKLNPDDSGADEFRLAQHALAPRRTANVTHFRPSCNQASISVFLPESSAQDGSRPAAALIALSHSLILEL